MHCTWRASTRVFLSRDLMLDVKDSMDLEPGETPLLGKRFCSLIARSRPAWCRHGSPRDPAVQGERPRKSALKPCEAYAKALLCAVLETMIDAIVTSHGKRNA